MAFAENTENSSASAITLTKSSSKEKASPGSATQSAFPNAFSQESLPSISTVAMETATQASIVGYHQLVMQHKTSKIKLMFSHLSDHDINSLLSDCCFNEDEVILRLITQPTYLDEVRAKYPAPPSPKPTFAPSTPVPIAVKREPELDLVPVPATSYDEQNIENGIPSPIPQVNSVSKKKTHVRKHQVTIGRLALDDALKQVKENPENAYEGWSEARIRAYKMIDENPNSYYYRFNAPGEEQRKGPWTDEEKTLFFKRLKDVGANSQWGIFSIAIPGRVGYQCSNFYRLLIETRQVDDPNYVLDEKGKAHYLFDKKTPDGQVQKTFRTHVKHGSRLAQSTKAPSKKRHKKANDDDSDDGDDTGTYKGGRPRSSSTKGTRASRRTRHTHAPDSESL